MPQSPPPRFTSAEPPTPTKPPPAIRTGAKIPEDAPSDKGKKGRFFPLIAAFIAALFGAYWAWQLAPDDRQLAAELAAALAAPGIEGQFQGTLQASPDRRFNWQLAGTVGRETLFLRLNGQALIDIDQQRLALFPGRGQRSFPLGAERQGRSAPALIDWQQLAGIVSEGPILRGNNSWRLRINNQQAAKILPGQRRRMVIIVDPESFLPQRILASWQIDRRQARELGMSANNQLLNLQLNFQSWSSK